MSSPSGQSVLELPDIRGRLEQAEKPLTAAALSKLFKQKGGKAFKPVLDAEVAAGRIYSWGASLYWHKDPGPIARERLLDAAAAEVLAASPLDKRVSREVPRIPAGVVREARLQLTSEGLLRIGAPIPGSKGKVVVNVRKPGAYLEQVIERLLTGFGMERSRERIRELLDEPDVREIADKIFAAMNRIAFAPGTTVTFYRLRQQPELAGIPKAVFDTAALLLQQERKAMLAVHDHAGRLAAKEQDELVTDGLGNYYVSIYAL
jgi:hypothetical protein